MTNESEPILQVTALHKKYGDLSVLSGVDFTINKGEIVSIVGASGAGKSTLLHIAGTLDRPDQGTITINGTETTTLSTKNLSKFRNEEIGFIFQFHHLLPEFTALENVCIPGWIKDSNKKRIEDKAASLLNLLGLSHRMHHKPGQLSGGEQQRVSVARALVNDPAIVFADEPSGNLDSLHAKEMHDLFFTLRAQFNQTFLIVTHNEELSAISDRKLVMKDGVIIG